jgi:3-dehydroquinate synthase
MTESAASKLPPHRTVRVDLGPRSYDVVIGRGVINKLSSFLKERNLLGEPVVIADRIVQGLYYKQLRDEILAAVSVIGISEIESSIIYDSGEREKSLKNYTLGLSYLAQKQVPRSGVVFALAGGVIGDLAGFVAATYLRGINFVQVPTTLLAMVDSSVGGKTGVNLPNGKNLVGAFHQPKLVIADLDMLETLPPREFSAGMAEVIKYGAIKDKALFDHVSKPVEPGDTDLDEIVEKCVSIKARIVENDEFETKGERALLNFGHTIGHAVEKATGYNTYLHGEAISLGMRAAAWLSVWQAGLPEADARRIEAALTANALPIILKPGVDRAAILAALGNDKKVASDGKNRWVLLKSLGKASSGWELPADLVRRALEVLG